ncbi:hypothetical protein [Demequina activiva]|uniref:NAD(P)-dependent oxidoreductase n=1 Tax=Demequina activiva TaxID=1582364 RepID=A0A919Q403_9MICO|nr:hypothetical protein [Demequina activiva]GIG54053.1 NAD(P)-dependent oxidoreductase [Demequina activiva]
MSPRRTLLVGFGKLGADLATLLIEDGGEVIALRRDAAAVPDAVAAIGADLRQPLPEPLPDVDALVVTLPPSVDPEGYPAVLDRLRHALPAIPERTVFVSSTGVFEGWTGRQPITESDIPLPQTERARGIREGELAAIDLFGAVVVRPAGIYGPGRDFLVRTVRDGRPIDATRRTNRIHQKDLVRAMHELLRSEQPASMLHAVDQEPARLGDVTAFIAGLLGTESPPEVKDQAHGGNIFDGTAVIELLGHLDYPSYRDGYREMLAGT